MVSDRNDISTFQWMKRSLKMCWNVLSIDGLNLAVSLHSCISRKSFPDNKFIQLTYFGSSSLQRGSISWAFSHTHSLFLKIVKVSSSLFNTLKNPAFLF